MLVTLWGAGKWVFTGCSVRESQRGLVKGRDGRGRARRVMRGDVCMAAAVTLTSISD